MVRIVWCLMLLAAIPSSVTGQPRGFIGAGFGSSSFGAESVDGGSPSTTYTNAIEPGRVTGLAAEAGVLHRRLGFGVEVWLPLERRTLTQQYNYDFLIVPYRRTSNYREWTLFGVLRGRLNDSHRISATWAAGGGLVNQSAAERYSERLPGSYEFGPFGALQHTTDHTFGLTGGLDLPIETVRRISIVPQFRVVLVSRDYLKNSMTNLGLDRLMTRIGVSIRATF